MFQLSVVIPAYNAGHYISRALESIYEQSQQVAEVIVVDDGSEDDTASKVEAWAAYLPILLIRNNRNEGIGASLRRGVEASQGDWVLRLDADDRWFVHHAASLAGAIRQSPAAVLATSSAIVVNERGDFVRSVAAVSDRDVRACLMWDNPLVHSATGFLRKAYQRVGGYREGVRWEDYDLWIRLLEIGKLTASTTPSVEYTVAMQSLSRVGRSAALSARWQCQRAAVRKFWMEHPFAAANAIALGTLRYSRQTGA